MSDDFQEWEFEEATLVDILTKWIAVGSPDPKTVVFDYAGCGSHRLMMSWPAELVDVTEMGDSHPTYLTVREPREPDPSPRKGYIP